MYRLYQDYLPAIKKLPTHRSLTKKDLLIDSFIIKKDGNLAMYYAPHNEYINTEANIVIVGITPGWNQMKRAYEQLLGSLDNKLDTNQILKEVKIAASFSGSIRKNLVSMLDEGGLHKVLNIKSSSMLFGESRPLLHTTSIIKYPVFYKDRNYTGHQPSIKQSTLLEYYAYGVFPKELRQIKSSALIIPLGKVVESVVLKLEKEGELQNHRCLYGFPHPSGANGHRLKQFNQQKQSLITAIEECSKYFLTT